MSISVTIRAYDMSAIAAELRATIVTCGHVIVQFDYDITFSRRGMEVTIVNLKSRNVKVDVMPLPALMLCFHFYLLFDSHV